MPNRRLFVLIAAFAAILLLPATASALQFTQFTPGFGSAVGLPSDVATGDFNGDGLDDIAVASGSSNQYQPGVNIRIANQDGSFSQGPTLDCNSGGTGCFSLVVGNFTDGDSNLDIFAYPFASNSEVFTFVGDGAGGFTRLTLSSPETPWARGSIAVGDLDGDDVEDILIGDSNGSVAIGIADGPGTFSFASTSIAGASNLHSATVGDFNGDGNQDAVFGDEGNHIWAMLGNGGGSITPSPTNPLTLSGSGRTADSIVTADFNTDGNDDIGVSSAVNGVDAYASSVQTFLGDDTNVLVNNPSETGTFFSNVTNEGTRSFRYLVSADFNKDGNTGDLAWFQTLNPNGPLVYQAAIQLSDGAGNFTTAPGSPFDFAFPPNESHYPWAQAVGDINGDGAPDLVAADAGGGGCNGCAVRALISAPDVILDPDSISYDKRKVGTTTAQSVDLVNQGGPAVTVDTITLAGDDLTQFELSTSAADCFGSLPPASSCPVEVSFKPTSTGLKEAQIEVWFEESEDPLILTLSGEGVTSAASVDPASLDLGNLRINTTDTETVTVTSSGQGSLEIDQLSLSGTDAARFSISNDECSNTDLDPNETCTVDVTASPTLTGELEATLEIPNDGVGASSISDLAITTNAIDPGISITPTSGTLPNAEIDGVGQVAQFTVTSEGTTPLTITGISVSGTNAADFGTLADQCSGETLDGTETCTFLARFNPEEGPEGTRSADLNIGSNAADLIVPVSGTATRGNTVISPDPVTFGEVKTGQSGTSSVTLTAAGTADMYVDDLTITGPDAADFAIGQDGCSDQQTPSGDSCEIELILSPDAIGTKEASFTVDTVTQIQDVDLTGSGINPAGTLTPASQDFGSVTIGEEGAARSFRVASTGTTPLTVTSASISGPDAGSFKLANAAACNGTKAPASNCDLSVSFAPQFSASTSRAATLTVVTDAGSFTSSLSGTAVAVPIPPVTISAKLTLKSAKKVKRGKKLVVKATLKNTGSGAIAGIVIGTTVGKKLAKTPKKIKVASLAPGKSVKKTIRVAVKKSAKPGKKLKVTVTASAKGKTLKSARRTVKIRK